MQSTLPSGIRFIPSRQSSLYILFSSIMLYKSFFVLTTNDTNITNFCLCHPMNRMNRTAFVMYYLVKSGLSGDYCQCYSCYLLLHSHFCIRLILQIRCFYFTTEDTNFHKKIRVKDFAFFCVFCCLYFHCSLLFHMTNAFSNLASRPSVHTNLFIQYGANRSIGV